MDYILNVALKHLIKHLGVGLEKSIHINAKHLPPGRSLSPEHRGENLVRGCPFVVTFFGQAKKVKKTVLISDI